MNTIAYIYYDTDNIKKQIELDGEDEQNFHTNISKALAVESYR